MPALSSMTGMYAERVHHSPSQHSPAAAAPEYEGVQRPMRPHELFRRYVQILYWPYLEAIPCLLHSSCILSDTQHMLELLPCPPLSLTDLTLQALHDLLMRNVERHYKPKFMKLKQSL